MNDGWAFVVFWVAMITLMVVLGWHKGNLWYMI